MNDLDRLRDKASYLRKIMDEHTETIERLRGILNEVSFELGGVEQEWAELACPFKEGDELLIHEECHSPLIVMDIFAVYDHKLFWAANTDLKYSVGRMVIDESMLPKINNGAYVKVVNCETK